MINIKNKNKKFLKYIENLIEDENMGYIDAIIQYCNEFGAEPSAIVGMIPKPIVEKLEAEAIDLNFIKSTTNKLEVD